MSTPGDDEEEYVPILGQDYSDEDASDMEVDAFSGEAVDEEDYLRGLTTGGEEEDDEEEAPSLFEDASGPEKLLAGLETRKDGLPLEAFDLLARHRRRATPRRRRSARLSHQAHASSDSGEEMDDSEVGPSAGPVFGAGVDDIWSGEGQTGSGGKPRGRKRAGRPRKRKGKICEEAEILMGEANMLYAKNEGHVEAIGKLMEVIRLEPNMPDPYHLLGMLHEAVGNHKKGLDFYMIAAHLTPKDLALWRRLAGISSEQGLLRQATYCLNQVLKRDKADTEARFERALLFADLGNTKKALGDLGQVASAVPGQPEVPKAQARLLYRLGRSAAAIEKLQSFMARYPALVDATHINILAELYTNEERWADVIKLLDRVEAQEAAAVCQDAQAQVVLHGEQSLSRAGGQDNTMASAPTGTPETQQHSSLLPADLRVKRGLAQLALGDLPAALSSLDMLLSEPVTAFADLFLEVGERLVRAGHPAVALTFLQPLAESSEAATSVDPDILAGLLADCHEALGDVSAALGALRAGLEDPSRPGFAALTLRAAALHRRLGEESAARALLERAEERLSALEGAVEPDYDDEHGSIADGGRAPQLTVQGASREIFLRRATLLHAAGKREAFLDITLPTLGATLRALEAEAEHIAPDPALRRRLRWLGRRRMGEANLKIVTRGDEGMFSEATGRGDRRKEHVRRLDKRAAELVTAVTLAEMSDEEEGGVGAPSGLVLRELLMEETPYVLLVQSAQALLDESRAEEARDLAAAALDVCGKRWSQRWKRDGVRLLAARASLAMHDLPAALHSVRLAAQRWPLAAQPWNTFAQHMALAGRSRQMLRFLLPQRHRQPGSIPIALLAGHCHLASGAWQEALSEYFHAFRAGPEEPLVPLCIAAALVNQASARSAATGKVDRSTLVLQAFVFLELYADGRKNPQESAYNQGRLAQQAGVPHLAVSYYKRALACSPVSSDPADDLTREAAHNLSLIYRASGAHALARQLAEKYLAV